ncbi:Isopenicillin N epimerase [Anatilimnocola aggregata]|uniref:Isopenicillin N epimerase n=1 Tax=Anatilimnocola aggregata TaxID=2528021 RepID=A0A517YGX1_9BACT|nr:aminotransferase class V-fold PLP-dependent enzyme [Anatilimnocola aggregata]QDU29490.1 Isopenicillin N epimerase [Anatilimnocola aggregata]
MTWQQHWRLRPDTIYLNHGSFGPPPLVVQQSRREWQQRLDEQPMDFFVRQLEPAWFDVREQLARFVGTTGANLVFVDNATVGMNIVADSFPLHAGDEVLLTNHEYGAVERIWQRACSKASAVMTTVALPLPFTTVEETVAKIVEATSPNTRLIVVSHVTSPTAVTLPVRQLCAAARERGIAVCIDGPHALVQEDVELDALGCDFYAASCHKWLCAPFGSGFLFAAPQWQKHIRPPVMSWGRLPPTNPGQWSDEFLWSGTRDYSASLAIPAAIDFINKIGVAAFREHTHDLARYARKQLVELTGQQPLVPDDPAWFCAMAHVPLTPGSRQPLQDQLWLQYRIEVPIVEWSGSRYVRVSCHLYNDRDQVDELVRGLKALIY